jgi:hypothetical protein
MFVMNQSSYTDLSFEKRLVGDSYLEPLV